MSSELLCKVGDLTYEWIADWAQIPAQEGWAHHGLAVTSDGKIVSGDATKAGILIMDENGQVERSFTVPVVETHAIVVSQEKGEDILWVIDIAHKYGVPTNEKPQILKCTMQGEVLARISSNDLAYGENETFRPTALSIDSMSGQVWIADGYGESRIHRLCPDLKLDFSMNGSDGGVGDFSCPHWVFCDTRKGHTEIYVADRKNNRIQVFDTEGKFIKCLSDGLITPSAFASHGDKLIVAELNARLVIFDKDDKVLGYIGEGHEYLERKGWPNCLDENDDPISPLGVIEKGKFNSPHGITVDASGNIYISEWLIGDRYTKLKLI